MSDQRKPTPWMPAWVSRLRGSRRRRLGRYDEATASLLRHAVERRPTPENLLAYLRFRRDLGHLPSPAQAQQLLETLDRLSSTRVRQAVNLLIECGFSGQVDSMLAREDLVRFAETSPPIAHTVANGDPQSDRAHRLAQMHGSQQRWREQFASYLQSHRASLCVVGNAGTLVGSGLGERIDDHQVVARFNHYRSDTSNPVDTGTRIDVWVRAPDLGRGAPGGAPTWVVMSGPDPMYQLSDWGGIVALLKAGARVITIPMSVWRRLVGKLEAPPSAGVLFVAWAIEILGAADALTAAGFRHSNDDASSRPYHQALPKHQASSRHHWVRERALFCQWRDEGLVFLE